MAKSCLRQCCMWCSLIFFSHVDTFQNLPQLWTEIAYIILKIYCTKMQSVGYWTCNNFWAHYFWHFGPYVSWHKVEHKIALINIVLTRYQQESLDTSLNLSVLVGPCKIIYPGGEYVYQINRIRRHGIFSNNKKLFVIWG